MPKGNYIGQPAPAELAQAIQTAASRRGVPAATLEGIWRRETGSTYPNPYDNGRYGGLFGLPVRYAYASTQVQADVAAQTLANLLAANGGNMSAALAAYSGGGYSSVGPSPVGPSAQPVSSRPRPGVGAQNEFASWWVGPKPWTLPEQAWNAITGSISGGWDVLKAFVWLADPRTWLRIVEFLTGITLLLLSLRALALVFVGRGSPAQPHTLAGASGLVRARARPVYDVLVPGSRRRHRRRSERAQRRQSGKETRRRDREYGRVPF